MLATAAAIGAPGVLIIPLSQEFGWSTASISSALAVRSVLFGLMGLAAAPLMNALGLRRVMLAALLLVGTGLLASLAMTRIWHLVLLWGALIGIGSGATALVLGATVATRCFPRRSGFVMGVLGAGAAAGPLVVLPAISALAEAGGWRAAVFALVVLAALAAVAVLVLVPEESGGADDGLGRIGRSGGNEPAAIALHGAARSGIFWVLLGTFAICGAATSGLVQTHFVPFCADYGLSSFRAANVLALMGPLAVLGSLGAGWLSDRFDGGWLLFWFYGLRGLSLLCLPFTDFSLTALAVFGMFYGLDWIATVPPTVKLIVLRFGRERATLILGWIFAGHQFGAAAAVFAAGHLRDASAGYLPAFLVAGVLCLFAAAALPVLSVPAGSGLGGRDRT
ncbi:MFS transporter [Methylobacterium durans]|nr:MFS transporter [Methylobacterium durans]